MKMLEKVVLSQLLNAVIDMSGFRYIICPLNVFNDILLAVDSWKVDILILLDLTAAFDTVD